MTEINPRPPLGVALIGAGTVGGGLARLLNDAPAHSPRPPKILHIVKRNVNDVAHLGDVSAARLGDDWRVAVADPAVEVVVELMGGTDAAGDCIRAALAAGKAVVTANKALLAESAGQDGDIFQAAAAAQTPLRYEAAIAGCIPIVKTLQESLRGDRINAVYGVINGTCNYILTAMESARCGFDEALQQAQQRGYAEADPTLDIDGGDTAHKLLLLSRLAFGGGATMADIPVQGIRGFDGRDIGYAHQFNYRIKLLATVKRGGGGALELRVRPTMLPSRHLLAAVDGATNAIVVESDYAGETMYYGAGAGAMPTAVAVAADILDLAARPGADNAQGADSGDNGDARHGDALPITPRFAAPFYLRLRVVDQPGVLADITRCLADHQISIEAIHQNESAPAQPVDIVIFLHRADNAHVDRGLADIARLPTVVAPTVAMPIERPGA